MIRLVDPLNRATAYAYNQRGWPTEVVDAKGGKKTLQWDEAGNLIAYADCSKRTTRFKYNLLGQLTTRQDGLTQHANCYESGITKIAAQTQLPCTALNMTCTAASSKVLAPKPTALNSFKVHVVEFFVDEYEPRHYPLQRRQTVG
jgi:YD repeat-containing protein